MKFIIALFSVVLMAVTVGATDYIYDNSVYGDAVIVKQRTVEMDARYGFGMDGYYSSQHLVSQQQTENRLDKVESQLEQLVELVGNINRKLENGNDDSDSGNDSPDSGDSNGDDTPEPTPDGVSNLDVEAYNIFANKCASCHGANKQEAGLQLVNEDNEELFFQSLPMRVEIFDRTNGVGLDDRGKSRMPVDGSLNDDEVETLRLWMVELAEKELE